MIPSNKNMLFTPIAWWEKRRLRFTIILGVFLIFFLFVRTDVPNSYATTDMFVGIAFWLFGANLCYCAGWGYELLFCFYLRKKKVGANCWFTDSTRVLLYWIGVIISIVWSLLNFAIVFGP